MREQIRVAAALGELGTWVADLDGRLRWDDRLTEIYGLRAGEFGGTAADHLALIHPDDREDVLAAIDAGTRGEESAIEHRCVRPDGVVRWLASRGAVVRDRRGRVLGTTGVTVDITDRRAADLKSLRRLRATQDVLRFARALADTLSPLEVAELACVTALDVFGLDAALCARLVDADQFEVLSRLPRVDRYPVGAIVDLSGDPAYRDAVHAGRTVLLRTDDSSLEDELRARLSSAGLRTAVVLPLTAGGSSEYLLSLSWRTLEHPDDWLVSTLRHFADQVLAALERAHRRQAEEDLHALTDRLQRLLLPSLDTSATRVQTATFYRPVEDRLLIGGDFYDAVESPEGVTGFCIGDVSGHGPDAAALAAQVRAAWRIEALRSEDPTTWIADLNTLVAHVRHSDEMFVTICCGVLDARTGSLRLATAGHPPPVLIEDGLVVDLPLVAAAPLGVLDESDPQEHRSMLSPSAWLVLYTDGLVEGRATPDLPERLGVHGLCELLMGLPRGADLSDSYLSGVLAAAERSNGGPLSDDIAMISLALPPDER